MMRFADMRSAEAGSGQGPADGEGASARSAGELPCHMEGR
jgi:hypothetical protein